MIALSAYVCGTVRLFQHLGETEATHAIERCLKRMERSIAGHGGYIVSAAGGQLFATFEAAEHACQAAIDMQARVATLPPVSGIKLPIRIGLHSIPSSGTDRPLAAPALLVAARIAGMAESDEILATSVLINGLPQPSNIKSRRKPEISLVEDDGVALEVLAIDWHSHEHDSDLPRQTVSAAVNQSTANANRLSVLYREKFFQVDAASPSLTIGRDTANLLVIADRKASRTHGLIERRGSSYFYIDRSTNGSHVRIAGQDEILVRRQEIELSGNGRIFFGGPGSNPQTEFVDFAHK
jgi:adenylate cyclase